MGNQETVMGKSQGRWGGGGGDCKVYGKPYYIGVPLPVVLYDICPHPAPASGPLGCQRPPQGDSLSDLVSHNAPRLEPDSRFLNAFCKGTESARCAFVHIRFK